MAEEDFDRLLAAMPKIAEAVKDLPEDLKGRAFEELVSTFRGVAPAPLLPPRTAAGAADAAESPEPTSKDDPSTADAAAVGGRSHTRKAAKSTGGRRPAARRSWSADKSIDFWPEGKQSFKDFVDAKQPVNLHQKNLLAVYWLEQDLGVEEVGIGQVLAAFKAVDWDEPQQPDTYLRKTASAEHWIDTSSTKAIKTTPGGRNMVKSMPIAKGKK